MMTKIYADKSGEICGIRNGREVPSLPVPTDAVSMIEVEEAGNEGLLGNLLAKLSSHRVADGKLFCDGVEVGIVTGQTVARKRAAAKSLLTGDSEAAIFRRALLRLTKPAGVTASDWLARFHAAVDAEI